MTINPRDYDLDELRKMARERGGGGPRRPAPTDDDGSVSEMSDWQSREPGGDLAGTDGFQSGLYRELLPLEAGVDNLSKPYLAALPESYAAEYLVFEWLEFLLSRFGYQGANEALEYYAGVGWITDDVAATLDDYLLGLEEPPQSEVSDTTMDDHKLSLVYVAQLVSMT
jgi:flagellar protein FlaE